MPTRVLRYPLGLSGTVADVLLDTDIFVDHLRGHAPLRVDRDRIHYSVVTRAELFAGSTATDAVSTLLGPFREIDVDRDVAERAGRIRREFGTPFADAVIAATALEHHLGLVTRNRCHFASVRGLRLRNPR